MDAGVKRTFSPQNFSMFSRKQIGIIDNHNKCEWVNVSSGTGSPGLSRTTSKEP